MSFDDPTWIDGIEYNGRELRLGQTLLFDEGVVDPASGSLLVTERAAGANLSVDVAPGPCAIDGDTTSDQGTYLARNAATVNLTMPAAHPSEDRIDLVVVKLRDAAADGGANRDAVVDVVEGVTHPTDPTAPAVPDSALVLASVHRPANEPDIADGDITDLRIPARLSSAVTDFGPGDIKWTARPDTPYGWFPMDGRLVSRTTYAVLFAVIGTTYGTGDGSTFAVPDLRGRVATGLGGDTAGVLDGGDVLGAGLGAQSVALTAAQLAAHNHTASADNDVHNHTTGSDSHSHGGSTGSDNHNHTYATQGPASTVAHGHPGSGNKIAGSSGATPTTEGVVSSSADSHTHTVSTDNDAHTHTVGNDTHDHDITVDNAGSGQAHPNVQPTLVQRALIKW